MRPQPCSDTVIDVDCKKRSPRPFKPGELFSSDQAPQSPLSLSSISHQLVTVVLDDDPIGAIISLSPKRVRCPDRRSIQFSLSDCFESCCLCLTRWMHAAKKLFLALKRPWGRTELDRYIPFAVSIRSNVMALAQDAIKTSLLYALLPALLIFISCGSTTNNPCYFHTSLLVSIKYTMLFVFMGLMFFDSFLQLYVGTHKRPSGVSCWNRYVDALEDRRGYIDFYPRVNTIDSCQSGKKIKTCAAVVNAISKICRLLAQGGISWSTSVLKETVAHSVEAGQWSMSHYLSKGDVWTMLVIFTLIRMATSLKTKVEKQRNQLRSSINRLQIPDHAVVLSPPLF